MATEVGVEAGGLAVNRRQARMDATGQGGIGGLAGEGLDVDLQGDALRYVGDRKDVL